MIRYSGLMKKDTPKRQKLVAARIGLEEAQLTHLSVLMRVTHKSRNRLIRDAIDYYFAHFRIGGDTLGEAETRYLHSTGSTTGVSRRRDRGGGFDSTLSRELPERRSGSPKINDKPDSNLPSIPGSGATRGGIRHLPGPQSLQ